MRRLLLFAVLALCATGAAAQNGCIDDFCSSLAHSDSLSRARIVVTEDDAIRSAVQQAQGQTTGGTIHGYRVRIFFDNGQQARQKAIDALSQFRSLFPGVPAYMVYENPYFKVSAGNCVTYEEAVVLWGNVKGSFDRAFVVREDFPLSAITETVKVGAADNVAQ